MRERKKKTRDMTITERLSDFIAESSLEKMPLEVISLTKRAMIDTLGVALAGSLEPAGKSIIAFVDKCGCRPAAGVIASKVRSCSPLAALANGTVAHALDYDDFQFDFQGHTSAVLVPVVLALGEETRASGRSIMEAYVLGVELWAVFSTLMPDLHVKGWHPTGVLGTISAAGTAAKLLKLTPEQSSMALGIACSQASGLLKNFGTMTKPLHAGKAAQNGIMAALLAQEGFRAAKDVLEGDANFLTTYHGSNVGNISKAIKNLGSKFALVYPGISVKKYPSCGSTHRALDAMLHLVSLYDIKPEQVESVKVYSNPVAKKILRYTNPGNALESKFSMEFAMAVALTDRRFGLAQVTDKKVNDPVVKKLMKMVIHYMLN